MEMVSDVENTPLEVSLQANLSEPCSARTSLSVGCNRHLLKEVFLACGCQVGLQG